MPDIYLQLLQQYWGYNDFRGIQRQIIESIGAGHDTLGLMPTGGGKSITFQVPALAKEGICIVITPLIALMKDQVAHLRQRGIRASSLHIGMSHEQIVTTLDNAVYGAYKFLYVSPERLQSDLFQQKLRHMNVNYICVDEAHCISQWGYDFRPSYLEIRKIRKLIPDVPVLALTATATKDVVKDIQTQLEFKQECVYRMSFERPNLSYIVQEDHIKVEALYRILQETTGSTIIYTRSRKNCWELSEYLKQNGFSATYYHAGLSDIEKTERQKLWQQDQIRIMVATNAFGMGIDKPDVRQVVHIELPDSLEAYYQEAGRAGRDGLPSTSYLFYFEGDKRLLKKRVSENFPDKDFIKTVYEHICFYYQIALGFGKGVRREFNIGDFCYNFKHYPVQVHSALNILMKCGYIEYTDADEGSSRVLFTLRRDELYMLHEQDKESDLIIRTLLRLHTGLFVDYAYIDEALIANKCGLTPTEVYNKLKELNKKHILHYIPKKSIPHISFTTDRVEKERIIIPFEVYEKRKEQYTTRIQAVIDFLEKDETCRNQTILAYFGEDIQKDCGKCDVCLNKHPQTTSQEEYNKAKSLLLNQIKEAKEIIPFHLNYKEIDRELAGRILHDLSEEESICTNENLMMSLTQKGLKKYFAETTSHPPKRG